jgi:hypothetical protein
MGYFLLANLFYLMNGFATNKYFYIKDIVPLSLLFLASQAMWDIFLCCVRTQDSCILQFLKAYLPAILIIAELVNWQLLKECRKILTLVFFNFKKY